MANSIDTNWPIPVSFYFQVEIGNDEIAFKEVSGLTTEMELETIQEGGVNEYEHRLPKQIKHGNLVLKRALMPITGNTVVKWINNVLNEGSVFNVADKGDSLTRTIRIKLQSIGKENKEVIYGWECTNAFPIKWEVETLDAEKNTVLIESLEFAYSVLKRLEK